jgi:ferrous iron transport protein A
MTEVDAIALQVPLDASLELPLETPVEMPLGLAQRGYVGRIHRLAAGEAASALSHDELESRLIELGFVEGARVEILHEGILGRDPIAVRVDNVTIAIRRREAMAIIVA